jgi:dinuclear metal center YbgI/SA1388 family protein
MESMTPTVADIIQALENIAPSALAENWDNVGLQIGHADHLVQRIWIALDPTLEVIGAACENAVDLIITHHPLFFSSIKAIDLKTPIGTIIEKAIRCNISIYSAHTNLDSAEGGLNDILADKIGLINRSVLLPSDTKNIDSTEIKQGLGRIGDIAQKTDLASFVRHVKNVLKMNTIRIVGSPNISVKRIALCTGSGSSLLKTAVLSGADVFLTGDIRYHDAKSAQEEKLGLIDIGHFNSEHIMVEAVTEKLITATASYRWSVDVAPCIIEKDPFIVL